MSATPLTWLRLYTETVDDEKLRLLSFEDRWHFIALLCCKGRGILDEPNQELTRRKIAVKLGLDNRTLDEVARRLAEVELIDEKTLQPLAWNNRQFTSDQDPTNAQRQKKYREKQKERTSNGRVTDCVTDESRFQEAETETEKDISTTVVVDSCEASSPPPAATRRVDVPPCPYPAIVSLYHETLPELRECRALNTNRKKFLRQGWQSKPGPDLANWRRFFEYVRTCPFLLGQKGGTNGRPPFVADLEWLVNPSNFVKIIEGKYDADKAAPHE